MALSATIAHKARIAYQRFGLGALKGGPQSLGTGSSAAYNALLAELNSTTIASITDSTLPSYAVAATQSQDGFSPADTICQLELQARRTKVMLPKIGFVERLVMFWSNHFSISINKDQTTRGMLGQLERDVIRKNVLGKFSNMLLGVIQHPAMICFLDNEDSMGPNSPTGLDWGRSYNENLGREILELHTLGVGGGYTQADVTSLAKVITGWSYVRGWEADNGWNGGTQANRGQFIYRDSWHEPASATILGKTYSNTGQAQGQAVLKDLAIHPSTAQHIAYKLVCHFITDTPTTAMVTPIANAFKSSGGDLKATAKALIDLPASWSAPFTKIRTPYELWMAQLRAFGGPAIPMDQRWVIEEPLRALDHLPWERLTPDGYPDESYYWLAPDAMRIREDTSLFFYDVFGSTYLGPAYTGPAAATLATSLFDADFSASSLAAVKSFSDQRRAMATLFMTPEFQRR